MNLGTIFFCFKIFTRVQWEVPENLKKFDMLRQNIVLFCGCKKLPSVYALPWHFQAKTFDYLETIWGVNQDDIEIFPKSKNSVLHASRFLNRITVKSIWHFFGSERNPQIVAKFSM